MGFYSSMSSVGEDSCVSMMMTAVNVAKSKSKSYSSSLEEIPFLKVEHLCSRIFSECSLLTIRKLYEIEKSYRDGIRRRRLMNFAIRIYGEPNRQHLPPSFFRYESVSRALPSKDEFLLTQR